MTKHDEYPKRVYRGSKGHTVHSIEEETALFGNPVVPLSPNPSEMPAGENAVLTPETAILTPETAVAYIMTKGYDEKGAKKVLKKEGLENIQKSFNEAG